MDAKKIAEAVTFWQNEPSIHPLTCGNNSNHQLLIPVVKDDRCILICKDCDYTQDCIPDIVLKFFELEPNKIKDKS
jgi:hypothetical protein